MKHLVILFLLLMTITDCQSQVEKRHGVKQIKTDTALVFQQVDNNLYKEKNVFWSDKNDVGIIHRQVYGESSVLDGGHILELRMIFHNWDFVELERDYSLTDLEAECELKRVFGRQEFVKPNGKIRLTSKSSDKLTFSFDVTVLSTDREKLLIYKGDREFVRDY